ncbi:phage baseplate assembly protein V [Microscilla marina]|uniref:Gp5/Type VI secretion system Vgr protein OB-fold domain-containing protein n=1 Tax=Microscilla marina ATCC 23134 TaxID=313606 RepID=A1ZX18_MICM2|nr:phage baseplate assembly protein V [Microscilla marina]EAY25098.1 hypothetical protein M23134_06086 [Microscilla marina ATCC 23134]
MAQTPKTLVNVQVFAGKDGSTAMPGEFLLTSVEIKKSINKIPRAILTFVDGGVAEHEKFAVIESGLFDQWNKVVIKAGYNNVIDKTPLFEGYIFDQDLKLGSPNKFTVTCFNQAKYLTLTSLKDVLEKKKPIEAVDFVLKNNEHKSKVKGKVKDTSKSKAEAKDQIILDPQVNCWKYILDNLSNYIAVPNDKELSIEAPDFAQTPSDFQIKYGKNLRSFEVKEASTSLRAIEIKGYDEKSPDKPLEDTKTAKQLYGSFTKYLNSDSGSVFDVNKIPEYISGTHIHTKADMENILETRKTQNLLGFKSGKIVISGSNEVELATMVEVEGLPTEYSQSYFVGGIEHKIASDWVTTLKIGLESNGLGATGSGASTGGSLGSSSSSSSGEGASASGNLTLGVVHSIHEDANGTYKIKVNIHKFGDKIVEARMVQPYAGNGLGKDAQDKGEGMLFFPNVGSEVILTPIEGDENYWVILGCLYSPVSKPSAEVKEGAAQPDEKNLHKSIVTKHFVLDFFDDDAKTRMTLASRDDGKTALNAKKYQISMDIKDKPNIQILFDKTFIKLDEEEGVMIDSAKNITLKAKDDILLDANKITIKAKADVAVDGQNVNAKAKVAFNAEGAQVAVKGKSMVNVESSGPAAVKGTPLNLG